GRACRAPVLGRTEGFDWRRREPPSDSSLACGLLDGMGRDLSGIRRAKDLSERRAGCALLFSGTTFSRSPAPFPQGVLTGEEVEAVLAGTAPPRLQLVPSRKGRNHELGEQGSRRDDPGGAGRAQRRRRGS